MTDDFERQLRDRLQRRARPEDEGVAHLAAFIATLPARHRGPLAGRSAQISVSLVGLAGAVLVGVALLVGLAGRGSNVGASPSPSVVVGSPAPSGSPSLSVLLGSCRAGSLAIAGSRQGEVGTVNVGVAITNIGTSTCTLGHLPQMVEILDASGAKLAQATVPDPRSVGGRISLEPGLHGSALLTFYWMNWCQAVPGGLQVQVAFADTVSPVTGPLAGTLLPACLDPSESSSIQIDGIDEGNLTIPPTTTAPSPPPPSAGLEVNGAGVTGTSGLWADANGQLLTKDQRTADWQSLGPWGLSSDVLTADLAWTVTEGPGSTEQTGSSSDVLHLVVSRTEDGGRTWTAANVPGSYPDTFDQVRFTDPLKGYLLAAASRHSDGVGRILQTTDGGATWHVVSTLMWPGSTFGVAADGTIWIGANAEAGPVAHPLLISSSDGGKTWITAVLPGLEGRTGGADLYVPEPPAFWSPSEGVVEVADSAGSVRLYRSHDGGRTWTLAAQRPTGGEGGGTEGGAFVSSTDWLLAEPGPSGDVLVRSTDGGASWTTTTPSGTGAIGAGILSLRFWDASNGVAVGFGDSGEPLLITSDGGASWTAVAGP